MFQVNAKGQRAEIMLYDNIGADPWFGGGISSKMFSDALAEAGGKPLTVRINSGGGSVFEGATMYNLLGQYRAEKTVVVDGLAASIASIIAMAGDVIQMGEMSWMMIHSPWSFAMGDADAMQAEADKLRDFAGDMAEAYMKRTGADDKTVAKWMTGENWFDAQEAVDAGLATEIVASQKIAAWVPFDRFGYKQVPKAVLERQPCIDTRAQLAQMEQALRARGIDTLKLAR